MSSVESAVALLRDPRTVRARAKQLLSRVRNGSSDHFVVNELALHNCAQFVLEVTQRNYPSLDVPFHSRWRHFEAGGVDRKKNIFTDLKPIETARAGIELAVISVLLDAGAGTRWRFIEHGFGAQTYHRSEGLAVASLHLFTAGVFANDGKSLRADSQALSRFSVEQLAVGFQVSESNPLVGLTPRAQLIQRLGTVYPQRLGELADELLAKSHGGKIEASQILATVLEKFSDIWPVRLTLGGYSLGDCWRHSALPTEDATTGLMPFHKLSQWLAYSLMEPLQWAGIAIVNLDAMTGLPEYRNGGLLLDRGVLELKDPQQLGQIWQVGDEFVVEWRALTVALLDEIGFAIRDKLNLTAEQLPLVKILQGGTWLAGRIAAGERRKDGGPPLTIQSDGTVF